MRRADELERRRLSDTFAALRDLPERSGHREAVALRVRNELTDLGFAVDGDPLGPVPVSLLCRLPGPVAELPNVARPGTPSVVAVVPSVVLGARLDTDVAVLLAVAHRARKEPLPCGVELLFTVGEDDEPADALEVDAPRLASAYGFFFDHAGPLGELVTASPTTYRLEVEFHRRPDAYRNGGGEGDGEDAVRVAARAVLTDVEGRAAGDPSVVIEELLDGGGPTDDETARLVAAVRSLDDGAAETAVSELVDRCYDAGNEPASACDVDVVVTRLAGGLRHGAGQPAVRVAEAALRRRGHEPHRVTSDRATDADRLTAAGVWCVRLGRGERDADPDELLDLVLTLLDEAAA